jgi:acetyltransferase
VIALDARVAVDDGPLAPSASYAHLAVHPYPKALTRTVKLADGQTMLLRPIRPEDAEADKRLVARLSPRTMYMRFHAPLRELTPERLARFTQIDYDREMAFVAIDTSGEQEEIRGVVRYTRNPDGRTAEFGVVVEDAWQGRGLGHAMMEAIEDCARDRGLEEIIGYVLTENNDMLQLMNVRGYRASRDPDDASVRRLAKKLREPAQSAAVAAA